MRKQIYLSLSRQLSTLLDADGQRTIKHFDLWNENVEFLEMEQPDYFPLCFVEFLPIMWSQLSGGMQMSNIIVKLHIVDQYLYPTADGSEWQSKGLEYLDLLDRVNNVLNSFSDDNFGSISRISSITNHNHKDVIESIEEFVFCVKDESGVPDTFRAQRPVPKFKLKQS